MSLVITSFIILFFDRTELAQPYVVLYLVHIKRQSVQIVIVGLVYSS